MGASTIMVVRHAESRARYNGQTYFGVDALATVSGDAGKENLITLGWERAGRAGNSLCSPWGPKPSLATPKSCLPPIRQMATRRRAPPRRRMRNPASARSNADGGGRALGTKGSPMPIDQSFSKKHFDKMVTAALAYDGAVLVAWQHEDIVAIGQAS